MSSSTRNNEPSGSAGIATRSRRSGEPECGCKSKLWTSRVVFVFSLCVVVAILGSVSNEVLSDSEEKLAKEHYEATAERALNEALGITLRKRLGAKSLATMMSYTFPDAATWPNVSIKGFEDIATSIIDVTTGTSMGLCPFVTSDQLAGFEDFAYNVAFPVINGYANTTGLRDFDNDGVLDRGVHSFNGMEMYQETNGTAFWGSPYDIICPFIMHSAGPRILMLNLHSVEHLGKVVDEVISCANNNTKAQSPEDDLDMNECAVLSDMIIMFDRNGQEIGPSAIIVQPIYPARDSHVLPGIIHSTMEWSNVLATLFSTEVSGIDCILETETLVNTFYVDHGVVTFKGQGDLHDTHFSKYRRSIDLYSPGLFSYTSASYTLTLYPTDDLFGVYSTRNPVVATIGSVCIVAFTAILFFLYDFFVQREIRRKRSVLEAKRKFVRFVSHEVRMPLGTVSQGCQLLQREMTRACRSQSDQRSDNIESIHSTSDPELEEWTDLVGHIHSGADSAVKVLNDVLNHGTT